MDDLVSKLGSLRTDITVTLHTHYATRVWQGRDAIPSDDKQKKVARIISMPSCISIIGQIYEDVANDDPYADKFLYELEKKIIKAREDIDKDNEVIFKIMEDKLPEGIDFEKSQSVNPVKIPIYIKSQLGYLLLYLLNDYDILCVSVLTASHLALLPKIEARDWVNKGSGYIRSIYGTVLQYRHSGITRSDVKAKNARYLSAVERLGKLEQEFIDGTLRSDYAPAIRVRASKIDKDLPGNTNDNFIENSADIEKLKIDD